MGVGDAKGQEKMEELEAGGGDVRVSAGRVLGRSRWLAGEGQVGTQEDVPWGR